MGQIIAAMASSHAYAFMPPEKWDERRQMTKANYARRYGVEPPEQPETAQETLEENLARYRKIRDGLSRLRERFQSLRPDLLLLVGDDQDEHFREEYTPQFAIYLGERLVVRERETGAETSYRCSKDLAWTIVTRSVEGGFDLSFLRKFSEDRLLSHAHCQVLTFLDPEGEVAVVPLFVNAIHVPGPKPARCYELGRELRGIIESFGDAERIVVYASGGLSHFTAGYPYRYYKGPHTLGAICHEFDRRLVQAMRRGRGSDLKRLSNQELLDNGDPEFRSWLILLGMVGDRKPELLEYEPFYRAVMGMGVGYWELEG